MQITYCFRVYITKAVFPCSLSDLFTARGLNADFRSNAAAYKQADGRKVDNRRVLVDVERGRTVPNWRPRRLGGGLGTTRVGGEEVNQKNSGR